MLEAETIVLTGTVVVGVLFVLGLLPTPFAAKRLRHLSARFFFFFVVVATTEESCAASFVLEPSADATAALSLISAGKLISSPEVTTCHPSVESTETVDSADKDAGTLSFVSILGDFNNIKTLVVVVGGAMVQSKTEERKKILNLVEMRLET